MYFFLLLLVLLLAEDDIGVVIVSLFLALVVVEVVDLFAEVVALDEIMEDDAVIFGGATCRIAIAAKEGGWSKSAPVFLLPLLLMLSCFCEVLDEDDLYW